jgi:selenium-binding protein 1
VKEETTRRKFTEMPTRNLCKRRGVHLLALSLNIFLSIRAVPALAFEDGEDAPKYLFICAGDQARTAPDFLAVINFDRESEDYGKVIATVRFAPPDATGNEPHHIGLSSDRKVVARGGPLSALKGQKEVLFFDVSNPNAPRFLSAADPTLSSVTDEFHPSPRADISSP